MSAEAIRRFAKQLDQERNALLDRLEQCTEEQLIHRPQPDDWCARGIAEHLMMAERYSLAGMPELSTLSPKPVTMKGRMMYPMATFILNSNISVNPPKGGAPSDKLSLAEIRSGWDESQQWLQTFVGHFESPELERPLISHPLLGPQPTLKLLKFIKAHYDYHKRQIDGRLAHKG